MSTDIKDGRTISLIGTTSALHLDLTFDLAAEESPRMNVVIRCSNEIDGFTVDGSVYVWGDKVYDLLDLSLCLSHLAESEDTTETLPDILSESTYEYRVSWAMCQYFFGCFVLMQSKDTPSFRGNRYITIFSYPDDQNPNHAVAVGMITSTEEVRRFAGELRDTYDEVKALGLALAHNSEE